MPLAFYTEAMGRSQRRITYWYRDNLIKTLENSKNRQQKGVDTLLEMAFQLNKILDEPAAKPAVFPPRKPNPMPDCVMFPVENEIEDILYKSTSKGSTEKYLKIRNSKDPENKFVYRLTTNWDYGWKHQCAQMKARDYHRGRCRIVRETFYRFNNVGPDPEHYAEPGLSINYCDRQ